MSPLAPGLLGPGLGQPRAPPIGCTRRKQDCPATEQVLSDQKPENFEVFLRVLGGSGERVPRTWVIGDTSDSVFVDEIRSSDPEPLHFIVQCLPGNAERLVGFLEPTRIGGERRSDECTFVHGEFCR